MLGSPPQLFESSDKYGISTAAGDVRKKNQQQLIFPSVLSPVACAPPFPLPLPLPLPLAQEPEPSASASSARYWQNSLRVWRSLFQVPKLVERSTRVEYFLHGVRLWQRG